MTLSYQLRYRTYIGNSPQQNVTVLLHDSVISGPITSSSGTVAKFLASERALVYLQDVNQEHCLSRLCDCTRRGKSFKSVELEADAEDQQDAVKVADMLMRTENP